MNEAPLPTQDALRASLPPKAPAAARPLRASLRACTTEGLYAEVVGACLGNAVVAAWAVHLGVSSLLVGALWGLPHFGQVLQVPASWITCRFGRRRVAVVAHALARQVTLPIALLPFVSAPVSAKRTVLVVTIALASLLGVIGHNAWLAWVADLVPGRVRGLYFGRRSAMCAVVSTFTSLAIASALDVGRHGAMLGVVLAVLVVARSLAGLATTRLMLRQHEPPGGSAPPRIRDLRLPFEVEAFRRLLVYRAGWGVATGLTASVSAFYMLRSLGLGFCGRAASAALVPARRGVTTPAWGRALDRLGARHVLAVCSFGTAASSLAWLGATTGHAWVLAIDAVATGLLAGGQELAVFTLPIAASPSAHRPLFAGVNVALGGVAFGLASVLGGALEARVALPTLLLVGTALRFGGGWLALRLDAPPRVHPVRSPGPALAPGKRGPEGTDGIHVTGAAE